MINEIIVGDVLQILKKIDSNLFDLGITSPPYNKKKNRKGILVKDIKYTDIDDHSIENEYQQQQIEILNELFRIIKPGCSFFYNHKIRWENGLLIHPMEWVTKTNWTLKQEIIWDRNIAANIRGWRFWQTDERLYWLYKPINKKDLGKELLSKHALLTSIWKIRPEMSKDVVSNHPAPFPIEIPTRIIFSIFDDEKNKLIIDPYIGSGTSAVAAKLLGHNYFGIDISETYVNQAIKRLENISLKETQDFKKEIELHKVTKTYADRKLEKKKFQK